MTNPILTTEIATELWHALTEALVGEDETAKRGAPFYLDEMEKSAVVGQPMTNEIYDACVYFQLVD